MYNNCRGTMHRAQIKNHAKSITNNVGFGLDRTEKGITLIALVVTVIVLLILAAVSLNLVAGSDGLLNRASSAVDATEIATAKEQAELFLVTTISEYYQEKYIGLHDVGSKLDFIQTKVTENGMQLSRDYFLKLSSISTSKVVETKEVASLENAYAIITGATELKIEIFKGTSNQDLKILEGTINSEGKVEWDDAVTNTSGQTPTPDPTPDPEPDPEPDPQSEPETYTITYKSNDLSGAEDVTETKTEGTAYTIAANSFSVSEGKTFVRWDTSSDGTGTSYAPNDSYTTESALTLYAIWSYTQSYNSQHPELHIPTGYHYLLGTVENGYVITDDNTNNNVDDGNEFVWIPVASSNEYVKTMGAKNYYMSSMSDTSGVQGSPASIAGDKLGTFPENSVIRNNTSIVDRPEASVVNAAGGFWVGRYEAGVPNVERSTYIANTQTNSNSAYTASNTYWNGKTIYSKSNYEPVRMITQSKSLELANNFGHAVAGEGTVAWQSGLITGAQWDAVCRFIGQSICDSSCINWGNYNNAQSKTYTDLYHSSDRSSDWVHATSSVSKGTSNNRWIFPTGIFVNNSNGTTEKKHIFDIAGNVWEWTTEAPAFDSLLAVRRGGGADSDGSSSLASTRRGNFSATDRTNFDVGCRVVIYVK